MPAPFRWITGLPQRAQREIERNFHWIEGQLGGGSATIYDAIIDPSQATDTTAHVYENLTDLLNNETLSATRTFTVGVVPHNNFTITETGALTLDGPLAISALGKTNAALAYPFGVGSRPKWDLAGNTIASTYGVFFQGLEIYNSGAQISGIVTGANGTPFFHDCILHGSDIVTASGTTRKITAPQGSVGNPFYAVDTMVESMQFRGAVVAVGLHYALYSAMTASFTLMPNGGELYWDGGSFLNHQTTNTTITVGGSSDDHYVRLQRMGSIMDGSAASGTHTFSINNSGRNHWEINALNNPLNVTVGSGCGHTLVKGIALNTVTLNGVSTNVSRIFEGSVTAGLSVTGPAHVTAQVTGSTTVTLTGAGINADLTLRAMGSTPWLTMTALTDSIVKATFAAPGAGSKAYTVDGTSARNVLVLTGTSAANFSVASTNASATTFILTEAGIANGAPPTGAAGGDLSGTYPNPAVVDDSHNHSNATGTDFSIATVGKGLKVKEGADAKMGVATLVAGTVTVSTTAVGANTRIFLTVQSLGTVATPMAVAVTARTAGTSFDITSEDGTDTSVVAWFLVEPA